MEVNKTAIAERFAALTTDKQATFLSLLHKQGIDFSRLPIVRRGERFSQTLSYAQRRQWFLWQLEKDGCAYHIAGALDLRGTLDRNALQKSFDALVERHGSLRTRFHACADGFAEPRVLPAQPIDIKVIDLESAVSEARIAAAVRELNAIPFDLTKDCLLRVGLIRLAQDRHLLIVVMHHIISDGASLEIIVDEFAKHYKSYVAGEQHISLAPLSIDYADYAIWQKNWLEAGEQQRQLDYWRRQLGSEHPTLQLPTDHPRNASGNYQAAKLEMIIPPSLVNALQYRVKEQGATLFMILLAGFQGLLQRYTGQTDIRVGVPIANRNRPETEGLVGFFVNTQVLRNCIDGRTTLSTLLTQTREASLGAQDHQDLPFEQLVEALQPERSLTRSPLFQVMFNHLRADYRSLTELPGLTIVNYSLPEQGAQFELSLDTTETADGQVGATFTYAVGLLERTTIERFANHYLALLTALAKQPDQALGDVDLFSNTERAQLQQQSQNLQRYPNQRPVHRLIEQQATLTPNATALIFAEDDADKPSIELSYGELNERTNKLAHYLIGLGVRPEARVGLAVERSIDMVVALLAILKAGGTYVALDPEYPSERLSYMILDSGVELLLTQSHLQSRFPQLPGLTHLALDRVEDVFAKQKNIDPQSIIHPNQLAYIIYTSGSTGRPKGIGIPHHALVEHTQVAIGYFGLTPTDRMLQFSTINFDGFVEQLFPPLVAGAAVVLRGSSLWDSETFYRILIKERVSIADLTTAYWFLLAQDFARQGSRDYGCLRQVQVTGEAMPPEGIKAWREAGLSHVKLLNTYGPTETTVTATAFDCAMYLSQRTDAPLQMPIGTPLAGRRMYIVDTDLNLALPGVAGELCIGGELLARGYVNRPALTAERFIADPFDNEGGRLYRTGDLVRWRADGQLEYLGRIDHQVKVRGFRIELGEVEAQLLALPNVREAVAVVRGKAGSVKLVAYVSSERGVSIQAEALKFALASALPDYMVPSVIVVMPGLPLNPNGKVDRHALPEPALENMDSYAELQGAVEVVLAGIWRDVLGIAKVGRHDNFFALGGDSIQSLQIVAKARRAGWKLSPKQLFERQTVASLALVAQSLQENIKTTKAHTSDTVPLLPIQSDFLAIDIPARHHWNQSVLLRCPGDVDTGYLTHALTVLVRHHDALRLRYTMRVDGQWSQAYDEAPHDNDLLWIRNATDASSIGTLCDEAQRSLDLTNGPLLRAMLIKVEGDNPRLLLTIHHLVVDGVSWRILLEDLQTAYEQAASNKDISLPNKTDSYQVWTQRLTTYGDIVGTEALVREMTYWQSLQDVPVSLPCDNPTGENTAHHQVDLTFKLDRATTQVLLKEAATAYRTQINDILLTALGRSLCTWSGEENILVELEGHGREDLFDDIDISRTVGWFTALFPVALAPTGDRGTALKRIKESLRKVPNQGIGYGALKYFGTPEQRELLTALPKPQVIFNYLGQFDSSFDQASTNASSWTAAKESCGRLWDDAAPLENEFSINGQVYEGELSLTVTFSEARHRRDSVESWFIDYRRELETMVAHCTSGAAGITPSDFPLANLTQAQADNLPVPLMQLQDLYPLSPMQAGMLFHSIFDPAGSAYVTQLCVDVDGLDAERFRAAWQSALNRHDILRTGFLHQRDEPLQWVARDVHLPLIEHDWRDRADLADALAELAHAQHVGFDLQQPPLMRLALVRIAEHRHRFIWTSHHLLLDGWSTSQLLGEVLRDYAGERLPMPAGGYRDYIAWLQQRDATANESYWLRQLTQLAEPTMLANALPLPVPNDYAGYGEHMASLSEEATHRLSAFARRERVTLNTVVQAAWAILLQRYTGQESVAFGATTAGRPDDLAGADQLLGLFINTLPVIARPRADCVIGEWLRELQGQNLASREYEHTPLYMIQRWADCGKQGLFDSILVFENYPIDAALIAPNDSGLKFDRSEAIDVTNYPMDVEVHFGKVLSIKFIYQRQRFQETHVLAVQQHVFNLLEAIAESGERCLGNLPLLTNEQRAGIFRLGQGKQTLSIHTLVHRLIERHAVSAPQATALLMGETKMCYGDLNKRANRLAHRFIEMGVQPEQRIGVAMERSLDIVVTFLAVLKTGGAYVPLDPDYPSDRLAFMMRDSGLSLLITHESLLPRMDLPDNLPVMTFDSIVLAIGEEANPDVAIDGDNLAYIIYTSGSTGMPKGVAVTHGPLAMHCQATAEIYCMDSHSCELLFMSFSFDGAHERWLTALTVGAGLAIRDNELWTAEQTYDALHRYGITNAAFPPAYLGQIAEWAMSRNDPPPVELYVFGGEAMPRAAYDNVRQTLRPRTLINGYGPTETVVTPLIWKTDASRSFDCAYAPIGKPVGERSIYIVDTNMELAPVGVIGELYVGGYGLARGYLGHAGLTAERFVADPFTAGGGRLYRTGDLVRWLDDGNVEYIGRADHQVKIRGFRIELGEIEARLRSIDNIAEAAVTACEGFGGWQLAAYVVLSNGRSPIGLAEHIKQRLRECLPEYMVPAYVVVLEALPRLISGKLDRKALPNPETAGDRIYVPPSSPSAMQLAEIWQQVLGVERVGETDNFFELGGDSLLSLKVMARIRRLDNPDLDFKLRDLMQRPTIAGLLGFDATHSRPVHEPVALNKITEHVAPLFCFHAGMGTLFDYQPLARHLQGKRTVYGLPCRMLSDSMHRDVSLDEMAADYCRMIRSVQSRGPYHLLGWSLGGALAAMVAALLEADGQRVAFLSLVDPFVPIVDRRDIHDWQKDFADFLAIVLPGINMPRAVGALSEKSIEENFESYLTLLLKDMLSQVAKSAGFGYTNMSPAEMARLFIVSRQLTQLSLQAAELPEVEVRPYCWWIGERALADRQALLTQLGKKYSNDHYSMELNVDHFAIVRTEAFILDVDSALIYEASADFDSKMAL